MNPGRTPNQRANVEAINHTYADLLRRQLNPSRDAKGKVSAQLPGGGDVEATLNEMADEVAVTARGRSEKLPMKNGRPNVSQDHPAHGKTLSEYVAEVAGLA